MTDCVTVVVRMIIFKEVLSGKVVEVEPYWVVQTSVVAARMLIGAKRMRASTGGKLGNMMQFEILRPEVCKTSSQENRG